MKLIENKENFTNEIILSIPERFITDNTKSASKNIFDVLAEEINNTSTDKSS